MGEKRQQQSKCLYEILGVSRDGSQEEIRSAYKKLALQLHPDKLVSSGISESEATAAFQSLLNAYQILSDPRERSWYDSHRSQILFSSPSTTPSSSSRLIDVDQLFPFFSNSIFSSFSDTGKGFYKVYGEIFSKIYAQELSFAKEMALDLDAIGNAPLIGNLDSPYSQVTAFYAFWMGFSTVLDFSWVDPYAANQGPSRKARRVMEDENRKARKKAKREFNEAVRGLAEFAKKRDKRVIEMQRKRKVEEEKRRAEEMERKKEESRKKAEKARLYKEPDWARIDDVEDMIADDGFDDDGDGRKKEKELYCIICNKKFKSEKQWGNHEQSKKHREKVAELRVSFKDEGEQDIEKNDENTVKFDGAEILDDHMDKTHKGSSLSEMPEENVDLCEEFDDRLSLQGEESEIRSASDNSNDDDEEIEASFVTISREDGGKLSGSDEELTILAAMVSGRKSRKDAMERQPETSSSGKTYEDDNEEPKSMEYDTRKGTRPNRGSKKARNAKANAGGARGETDDVGEENMSGANGSEDLVEKDNTDDISCSASSGPFVEETKAKIGGDEQTGKARQSTKKPADRKDVSNREKIVKAKSSSKGKRQKATSKASSSGHACETCGENFESRNKLHIHLGNTGHAMLKAR